jgi:hypothetical protein
MRELECITAWKLNDNCQADTAGKPREGTTDAVDGSIDVAIIH